MRAALGINFIIGINKLPSFEDIWWTDKYIGNEKTENNDNGDETDKSYKIHPVIEHLNKVFAETSTCASLKVDWVWNNI